MIAIDTAKGKDINKSKFCCVIFYYRDYAKLKGIFYE